MSVGTRQSSNYEAGFEVYKIWKPLFVHFTEKGYHLFENGRLKHTTYEAFMGRKDQALFEIIGGKVGSKTLLGQIMVANFAVGNNTMIWEWDNDVLKNYNNMVDRKAKLTYNTQKLVEKHGSALLNPEPFHNPLYGLLLSGDVSPETGALAFRALGLYPKWVEASLPAALFEVVHRVHKYIPFVRYDELKLKNLFRGVVGEKETR